MAKITKATISYEIENEEPSYLLNCITTRFKVYNEHAIVTNLRPMVRTNSPDRTLVSKFNKASKLFRAGTINMREIAFPVTLGETDFITALASEGNIDLVFRHNAIEANNYNDAGDIEGTHFLPHIFFLIRIFTDGRAPFIVIINTPYNVDGRMFPHNSGGCSQMTSSFCAGAYQDQFNMLVTEDDLTLLVSSINGYLLDGTNVDDEYGRSYYKFAKDRAPSNFDVHIASTADAKLLALVLNDPTVPWGVDLKDMVTNYKFSREQYAKVFLKNYCGGGIIND